jgi:hypothetical protein
MTPCHDFAGKEITAGATIAYPVRQSSSMWLDKALVDRVEFVGEGNLPSPHVIHGTKSNGRRVKIKNIKTTVVI